MILGFQFGVSTYKKLGISILVISSKVRTVQTKMIKLKKFPVQVKTYCSNLFINESVKKETNHSVCLNIYFFKSMLFEVK